MIPEAEIGNKTYRWLRCVLGIAGETTAQWEILNRNGHSIGLVSWANAYRKYGFYPRQEAYCFEEDSLRDIADFLDLVTTLHRKGPHADSDVVNRT